MIQTAIIDRLADLSAFCMVCPDHTEVTAFLGNLGFSLDFSLPAKKTWEGLPDLPAQYHYKDGHGTEVIFLAGPDTPCGIEDGKYPRHASRWWIYPGYSQCAYDLVAQELRARWGLSWQPDGGNHA